MGGWADRRSGRQRIDVRNAELFVGTSAGSVVAAQITSCLGTEDVVQRQIDPRLQSHEPPPLVDFNEWRADLMHAGGR